MNPVRFLAACLCAASAAFGQAHWPQFRGPGASGAGTSAAPIEWNAAAGKNILWKTRIPGLGLSSPVVHDDRIFLTSAVPAEGEPQLKTGLYGDIQPVENEGRQDFIVIALDRKTGRILWQRTAASGVAKIKRHPKSSHANPTPATDGRHVVVSFGSEGLYCYDLNGKLLWKKDLGRLDAGFFRVPQAQWGFASSPVIYEGKVIIQADVQKDSFLAAFDVATGNQQWRTPRGDVPTFSTPSVAPYGPAGSRGKQVVVNGWKHIGGYDLDTGKELWRLTGGGDIPVPTPVLAGDVILITSAHGGQRPIYAIRTTARGDITGNPAHIAWQQDRAGNYMQTPLAQDGLAYFCFDNGILTVYQASNGERIYQHRLGGGTSGFSSSPVAAGGKLYITSEEGTTHVIQMGREFRELGSNEIGEQVMATPAIAGSALYIRGRHHLFAIADR